MTAEEKTHSSSKRALNLSPWLVVLGALLVYGVTLHHWVTLASLPMVSKITDWDWHPAPLAWRPTQVYPLFDVLTLPIRVLPVSWEPLALNAFAALCGALTLGLLAASVRLLPQDRTREQRQREGGEFALLSVPAAFLPPLFAILMMGFQLTFWRGATASTGDMLDLLVFAFLVFCLLKFRVSQSDAWLSVFALAYGLGMTNNWALIGFLPLFLVSLVWIKGVSFFNLRFLGRMLGFGLLGLLLYLVIPAIGSLSGERANFFDLLHMELGAQSFGLRMVPRWIIIVAGLPTLLPLLFAGIKWPSFEGELSAAGSTLTKLMFRVLHIVFLLLALIMFFDFKFSPSLRLADLPLGFLTFFYIGALCIGYYSGYVLLVFGKSVTQGWEKPGGLGRFVNPLVVGLLCLLAIVAPCSLFAKNIPRIMAGKSDTLSSFATELVHDLPAKPVIVLCDDPVRLYLLNAAYRREGKPNPNIMLETGSLPYREYITRLLSQYPDLKKVTPPIEKFPRVLSGDSVTKYLYNLSHSYSLYYLQPSFGYYFEVFYLKPHGLAYELQVYPKATVAEPGPTPAEVQENQAVWARIQNASMSELPARAKLDPDCLTIADNYSMSMDVWGVRLQKAGYLKEANAQFAAAQHVRPQNLIAKINQTYNERLQKNNHQPADLTEMVYKARTTYGGLVSLLKFDGQPDEPNMNLEFGTIMAQGGDYRQAAILFERRLQLLPNDVAAELDLAKTFVDWQVMDKAFDMIAKLRANPAVKEWDVARVEALAYLGKQDIPAAEKILAAEYRKSPQDESRVSLMSEFYRKTAYYSLREAAGAARQTNQPARLQYTAEAGRRFTNALAYINQEIQLLTQASHNSSNPYGVPEILMKKAEVEMMLKDFKSAIATLNQVMELQPKNATALLNRAIAESELKENSTAKGDYMALRKLLPAQRYIADYGLADLAAREKNTSEEIHFLQRYLAAAPDDQPEYQQAKRRLRQLELR